MNAEFNPNLRQDQFLVRLGTKDIVFATFALLGSVLGPASIISYQIINSLAEVKSELRHVDADVQTVRSDLQTVRTDLNRLSDKVDSVDARVTEVAVGLAELRGELRGRLALKEQKKP